ncbi:glycosyltransferase family 4 protein [Lapidilactobacillus mulanensis]|uniref:Glycosyltransferase family 4 protein n=1 Tax=Lapidilactobacillus mulanensis TaxID=2485999 RepID=A0ABW4DM71_9LACO|nr:MraY family glycosyltransferase [Lapidilactobacillus mulanensis]
MFPIVVKIMFTVILSALITPFVRKLAIVLGAVDQPNARRINQHPVPTLGGLGIFISFTMVTFILLRNQFPTHELIALFLAECLIVLVGMVDDIKELSPWLKLTGIIIAGLVVYFLADIRMDNLSIPLIGNVNLGVFKFPITMLWIVAITNAVNLIDGLDGLATGVSVIGLFTMGVIGYFFLSVQNAYPSILVFCLVAALIGFLPHNFYPASIFLGDTGSLFIGFMIAVLSLKGLKNVTFVSLVIPIVILGVPITDTIYAIIRRLWNRQPITKPDKLHLHHRLLNLGFSQRQSVLIIYGLALIFSFVSLLYPLSSRAGNVLLTLAILIGIDLLLESIGITKLRLLKIAQKLSGRSIDDQRK